MSSYVVAETGVGRRVAMVTDGIALDFELVTSQLFPDTPVAPLTLTP